MFDIHTEIGYDRGVTESPQGFFIAPQSNTRYNSTSPALGQHLADSVTGTAIPDAGYFITKKNRASLPRSTRFSESYCAMSFEYLNATIIPKYSPLVKNLIGGHQWL